MLCTAPKAREERLLKSLRFPVRDIFFKSVKAGLREQEARRTELHLIFWYFWLTIQNTADRQVRNLFSS